VLGANDPLRLAQVRGLLSPRGIPTVAGILIFGRRPTAHLPQAFVRVIRHLGTEARPGRELAIESDRRYEGALPRVIDDTFEALAALLPKVERLGTKGRFVKEPLYPPFALREAITNAVIHRSYSLGGDHIRVGVFTRLAEHLQRSGMVTSREAGAILGLSRPTTLKRLKVLAGQGLLEWKAQSTTDPTGFWRLPG